MEFGNWTTITGLLFSGAAGALVKDILDENSLKLPKIFGEKLFLGFLGSVIIGAAVGLIVDNSPMTAFFAGYTGFSAVATFMPKKEKITAGKNTQEKENPNPQSQPATLPANISSRPIAEIITLTAQKFGVNPTLAMAVAKCESGLDPKARGKNSNGTEDRGLYQINNYWHPEVTDAQAYDPVFATEWFCRAVAEGHLDWWNASRKCWAFAEKK